MKPRDTALRLKRFEAAEKARKVASMETMVLDLEQVAADLARQIAAEEERTGIKDPAHFAYSTFAKAAAQRRAKSPRAVTAIASCRRAIQRVVGPRFSITFYRLPCRLARCCGNVR